MEARAGRVLPQRPMELFVYSRGAIEALPPHDVPHVIISITTVPDDQAKLRLGAACRGVLRLSFVDADEPRPDQPNTLFGRPEARAIREFVTQHHAAIARIVVHCDAGLSRSPAVAAALAVCLGQRDEEFFRRYRPNMLVYWTLLDEWQDAREAREPPR